MEGVRMKIYEMGRPAGELYRRVKRLADGPLTRKKVILIALVLIFMFLYIGPGILRWLFKSSSDPSNPLNVCQSKFLEPFQDSLRDYDAYLRQENKASLSSLSHNYVPYVGNGLFGLTLEQDAHLNIKFGRTLSLPVYYHPLYIADDYDLKEFTVTEYVKGIVHRFQCSDNVQISYQYYAHRTSPSLFVQEILVNNPTNSPHTVRLITPRVSDWPTAVKQTVKLHQGVDTKEYEVVTGMIMIPDSENVIAASIVTRKHEKIVQVEARDGLDIVIFTTVQYSKPIKKMDYAKIKDTIEKKAVDEMERVISSTGDKASMRQLKDNHARVWQGLWYTGFYISDSKAEGVINGDRINATIYALLSQVRSYENEDNIKPVTKTDILKALAYSEGCYEGHSTLDASNLWKPLSSLSNLNNVASIWMLTLEKQGCHNLLKAGASGVNQAVILSFGSLRFSNQHLEYNIHPSQLHRDFLFRRLNYGNMTHVNISVVLQEDNRAALFVALDRSDRNYYACDAGCLDKPVALGPYRKYFPVKLTEPLTAILYITADKQHMEDLRHAIHVKEVVEAPAHEHHIIALHKHGHSFGGLNPLLWISIIILVVLFHLFLCRIIMNEFCDSGINYKRLYNKP